MTTAWTLIIGLFLIASGATFASRDLGEDDGGAALPKRDHRSTSVAKVLRKRQSGTAGADKGTGADDDDPYKAFLSRDLPFAGSNNGGDNTFLNLDEVDDQVRNGGGERGTFYPVGKGANTGDGIDDLGVGASEAFQDYYIDDDDEPSSNGQFDSQTQGRTILVLKGPTSGNGYGSGSSGSSSYGSGSSGSSYGGKATAAGFSAVRASVEAQDGLLGRILLENTFANLDRGWLPKESLFQCRVPGVYFFTFSARGLTNDLFRKGRPVGTRYGSPTVRKRWAEAGNSGGGGGSNRNHEAKVIVEGNEAHVIFRDHHHVDDDDDDDGRHDRKGPTSGKAFFHPSDDEYGEDGDAQFRSSASSKEWEVVLRLNGAKVVSIGGANWTTASNSILLPLNRRDRVWIELVKGRLVENEGRGVAAESDNRVESTSGLTSFTGYLVSGGSAFRPDYNNPDQDGFEEAVVVDPGLRPNRLSGSQCCRRPSRRRPTISLAGYGGRQIVYPDTFRNFIVIPPRAVTTDAPAPSPTTTTPDRAGGLRKIEFGTLPYPLGESRQI